MNDLTFSWRMLRRTPGATLLVIATLALGIGANSAIFNFFEVFINPPLPYREPDRLVYITGRDARNQRSLASEAELLHWRQQKQVLERAAAFRGATFNLSGDAGPERVKGDRVTEDFFATLGVRPALGRDFVAEDFRPGAPKVILLSHPLWQRSFDDRPGVVGRAVVLDGAPATIAGVLPADFRFILGESAPRLWVPLPVQAGGTKPTFGVIARLQPGIPAERARADLEAVAGRLREQFPESNRGRGVRLDSLRSLASPRDVLLISLLLQLPVGLVLLIGCTNVANILLAKAAEREKEIAVRAALGASRWRIVRQLLTESLLFSLLAGAASLIMAVWASRAIIGLLPFDPFAGLDLTPPRLSPHLVAFTVVIAGLSSLLCGLLPALRASRVNLNESLKAGGGRLSGRPSKRRTSRALIVSEVAISMVLLIGAGLVIKSYGRLRDVHPGYRRDGILTMHLTLAQTQYPDAGRRALFLRGLQEQLSRLPGVKAVSLTSSVPPMPGTVSFRVPDRVAFDPNTPATAFYRSVSPNYYASFSIPLLRGRPFGNQDASGSLPVAIINQAMAKKYWPDSDPVGARVEVAGTLRTIVGIAGNVKNAGLQPGAREEIAVPYTQECPETMTLAIEATGEPLEIATAVRRQIQRVDPNQPVSGVETMRNVYVRTLREHELLAPLLAGVGGLGLGLAVVGIYGFTSYWVSLRRREIGIRLALGATRSDVLRLVLRQGLALTLTGVALGALAAGALMRALSSVLYGVSTSDPATFSAVSLLLAGVSVVAWYLPARRAAAVDLMATLRSE